jgi:glutamate carboxypeptidase
MLLAHTAAALPEMLEQLRAWVEWESPSQEPERVRGLAREVAAAFESAGCRATFHPDALELTYPGTRDAVDAPILLLGHLDTVYPVGSLPAMPFRLGEGEEADRAYGPGVFDMKAGLVQALCALQALRHSPRTTSHSPITLLFVYDEEIGSPRSREQSEPVMREARAVLVLEPAAGADGKLKIARKGTARYRLTAHGVAAHAGLDFALGASAIVELAHRVVEVAGWSAAERGVTVNAGLIAGGTAANVVAGQAHADIDARAWTAAEQHVLDSRFRSLVATDARVRLEVDGGISRPPMEVSPASDALRARAQNLAAGLGFTLGAMRVGGASDGNLAAALGRPTLDGLGAVGAGAHTADEHILIAHLAPRAALLAALLAEL